MRYGFSRDGKEAVNNSSHPEAKSVAVSRGLCYSTMHLPFSSWKHSALAKWTASSENRYVLFLIQNDLIQTYPFYNKHSCVTALKLWAIYPNNSVPKQHEFPIL